MDQIQTNEYEEFILLKLQFERLCYLKEKEGERNKTIETKASIFIGSTSIMGAILVGCSNLITENYQESSYLNFFILLFLIVLVLNLGRSIIYSILVLRKRPFYEFCIEDLTNINNAKDYYSKLIETITCIIKNNKNIIDNKVDLMQKAQDSFENFGIWSLIFIVNLLGYNVFNFLSLGKFTIILIMIVLTIMLLCVCYLFLKNLKSKYINDTNENITKNLVFHKALPKSRRRKRIMFFKPPSVD